MPGVGDAIRKTQLGQEHQARKSDMQDLIRMVDEGRLNEADGRQLELLKLALELNNVIGNKTEVLQINPDDIANAVSKAMESLIAKIPAQIGAATSPLDDPERPGMKHTSLADLQQSGETVKIVDHGDKLGEASTGTGDSKAQREKLKRLRGGKG